MKKLLGKRMFAACMTAAICCTTGVVFADGVPAEQAAPAALSIANTVTSLEIGQGANAAGPAMTTADSVSTPTLNANGAKLATITVDAGKTLTLTGSGDLLTNVAANQATALTLNGAQAGLTFGADKSTNKGSLDLSAVNLGSGVVTAAGGDYSLGVVAASADAAKAAKIDGAGATFTINKGATLTLGAFNQPTISGNFTDTTGSTVTANGNFIVYGTYTDQKNKGFTVNQGGTALVKAADLGAASPIDVQGGAQFGALTYSGPKVTIGTDNADPTKAVAAVMLVGNATNFKPHELDIEGNSQLDIDDLNNDSILYKVTNGVANLNGTRDANAHPAGYDPNAKPVVKVPAPFNPARPGIVLNVLTALTQDVQKNNPAFANATGMAFLNTREVYDINHGATMGLSLGTNAAAPAAQTLNMGNNSALMIMVDPVLGAPAADAPAEQKAFTQVPQLLNKTAKDAITADKSNLNWIKPATFAGESKAGANDQPGIAIESYYPGTYAIMSNATAAAKTGANGNAVDPTKLKIGSISLLLQPVANTDSDTSHSYVNANGVLIQDFDFINLKEKMPTLMAPKAFQDALNLNNAAYYQHNYNIFRRLPDITGLTDKATKSDSYPLYQFLYNVINKTGLDYAGKAAILNATAGLPAQAGMSRSNIAAVDTFTRAIMDHHTDKDNYIWATYTHGKENVNMPWAAKGDLKSDTLIVGADLSHSDARTTGLALAYETNKYESTMASSADSLKVATSAMKAGDGFAASNDGKHYGIGLYSHYRLPGNTLVKADITYMHNKDDVSLTPDTQAAVAGFFHSKADNIVSTGDASTNSLSVGIIAEKSTNLGGGAYMNPYIGLRYNHYGSYDFTSNMGLAYKVDSQNVLSVPLGLRYFTTQKAGAWTLRPMLELGGVFSTNTKATASLNGGDSYKFDDLDNAVFVGKLALQLEKPNQSIGLAYKHQSGSHTSSNDWTLQANIKF